MESNKVYTIAYNELCKLERANTCGSLTIDYTKLDERTSSELRLAMRKVIDKRKKEIYSTIGGAQ